jgi:hypothetical protein
VDGDEFDRIHLHLLCCDECEEEAFRCESIMASEIIRGKEAAVRAASSYSDRGPVMPRRPLNMKKTSDSFYMLASPVRLRGLANSGGLASRFARFWCATASSGSIEMAARKDRSPYHG